MAALKDEVQIKFAMQYALLNEWDEIVCVDQNMQAFCKHISHVKPGEKFTFSVVHLGDSSRTG